MACTKTRNSETKQRKQVQAKHQNKKKRLKQNNQDGRNRCILGNRPLFFLKTGCPNKVLVVLGNRATANFEQ